MTGARKFKAWLITTVFNFAIFGVGIFANVQFTPDSLTTIVLINSSLAGAFFTANFGEHWSKAKQDK
jgi:hypothetical protein